MMRAGDPYTRELVLGDLAVVTGASIVGTSTIGGHAAPLGRASLGALGGAAKVVASRDRVLVAGGAAEACLPKPSRDEVFFSPGP
jgi:hypothetical protein